MASPTKEELTSSSSSMLQWSYDIFLSFRGEDTRYGFTGYLYGALCSYGLNNFFDTNLKRGEEISKELYSEYNNIIYFYSNGIQKIKLEEIKKENSLIPKENQQNNLQQIADNIISDCNEKFGNNYNIEIYSDGYCKTRDNKLMDYILSDDDIELNGRSFQLLQEIEINV